MSTSKIADNIADIRNDPEMIGRQLAYQPLVIQERFFQVCQAFIQELAIQDATYSYVNGNMELTQKAREIQDSLLTDTY